MLRAVDDEFTTEHFDVRVKVIFTGGVHVAEQLFRVLAVTVERVGTTVQRDESLAIFDGVQECGLAGIAHAGFFGDQFIRHVLLAIGPGFHRILGGVFPQIFGGVKHQAVKSCEIFRGEQRAVFRAGDVESVFRAKVGKNLFRVGELVRIGCRPRDHTMLESGGLGEEKNLLDRGIGGEAHSAEKWRDCQSSGGEPDALEYISTIEAGLIRHSCPYPSIKEKFRCLSLS